MSSVIACREGRSATGGRGNPELRAAVDSLLVEYFRETNRWRAPVLVDALLRARRVTVHTRRGSPGWTASLMPVPSGFVAYVSSEVSSSLARLRNALCHELAHTFFFQTGGGVPQRKGKLVPDEQEELLCFWAARQILVPRELLEPSCVGRDLFLGQSISGLADEFGVSIDVMCARLSHDEEGRFGKGWLVLWHMGSAGFVSQGLYPQSISSELSPHYKRMINSALRKSVDDALSEGHAVVGDLSVGTRKRVELSFRTEMVRRRSLRAISWVTLDGTKSAAQMSPRSSQIGLPVLSQPEDRGNE